MAMAKKILVTGADGFIGSHLTEHLVRSGYDVRAFCLYNSQGSAGWPFTELVAGLGWSSPTVEWLLWAHAKVRSPGSLNIGSPVGSGSG